MDFGRAIDVQSFPRGTQFVGSCGTDSFQCMQMLNNEPWSWHVRKNLLLPLLMINYCFLTSPLSYFPQTDLHCIAGTVHVLLHLDYMEAIKNPMTGEYIPSKSLPRCDGVKRYLYYIFVNLLHFIVQFFCLDL